MTNQFDKKKFMHQDSMYKFPYHHLPEKISDNVIKPFRVRYWLYNYLNLIHYLKKIFSNYENKNILDFGCGDGRLICELKAESKNNLFGYEISSKASMFFKAFNEKVKLFENYNELKKKENFFDFIILSEVIEHIPDSEVNLNIDLIHDILKKDGIIIVTAPHKNIPVHKKHYRHYDSENLLQNFPSKKFELIEKQFLFKKNIFLTFFRKLFFNRFFIINSNLFYKLYYKVNSKFFFGNENNCETILIKLKKK